MDQLGPRCNPVIPTDSHPTPLRITVGPPVPKELTLPQTPSSNRTTDIGGVLNACQTMNTLPESISCVSRNHSTIGTHTVLVPGPGPTSFTERGPQVSRVMIDPSGSLTHKSRTCPRTWYPSLKYPLRSVWFRRCHRRGTWTGVTRGVTETYSGSLGDSRGILQCQSSGTGSERGRRRSRGIRGS